MATVYKVWMQVERYDYDEEESENIPEPVCVETFDTMPEAFRFMHELAFAVGNEDTLTEQELDGLEEVYTDA